MIMRTSILVAFISLAGLCATPASGKLHSTFYEQKCPEALSTVKALVKAAVADERGVAAQLLRLHFHDCFIHGCDGSILTISGEMTAPPNNNSVRGFDVIDAIKSKVEAVCRGVVSCADILAIAARDSVVELGGPTWKVRLGRRDSTAARRDNTTANLPSFNFKLSQLISYFGEKSLSTRDMVALSGGHTIGIARCLHFRDRIYHETNIDPEFAASLQAHCPFSGGDNNTSPMDVQTPAVFDNKYYKNLRSHKGLFTSDQQLFNGGSTDSLVTEYSENQNKFFKDFASAMVKMGNIEPLTGAYGEIRKICRQPN